MVEKMVLCFMLRRVMCFARSVFSIQYSVFRWEAALWIGSWRAPGYCHVLNGALGTARSTPARRK
ncbi:MAG: hypothetical protein DME26_04545 [Verrucomicrobia bacterium]|nr:MAG: hypothetical protein DME26_04545 [Verrucomicrobiota bacterium]